ncbi:helix-turn-helix domain-containing protein [Listeria monocytogenes]
MEKTLGETIKFIRTSKNISQKEVCLDQLSRSALVKIESNKTIPSALTLDFILLQLGIQQEEFSLRYQTNTPEEIQQHQH